MDVRENQDGYHLGASVDDLSTWRLAFEWEESMKAVKATYENGKIVLTEIPPDPGPMEVLVVFSETKDDAWESILAESTPRPAFTQFAQKCIEKIAKGKAKPLELDQL